MKFFKIFDNNFYKGLAQLGSKYPFYGAFASQCTIESNEQIKTISIREEEGTFTLSYCASWFDKLTLDQASEAIRHSLTHVIFGHLEIASDNENVALETAKDLAVNSYLQKDALPKDFLTPDIFGWPNGLSTQEYYTKLQKLKFGQSKGKGQGEGEGQGKDKGQGEGEGQGQGEGEGQGQGEGEEKPGDNHGAMTRKNSQALVQQKINNMAQRAVQKGGRTGAPTGSLMDKLFDFLLGTGELPWNIILRRFVANSAKALREPTWKRPNRRFGEMQKGNKKKPILRIFLAIDESGSVGDKEWKSFLDEIEGILLSKKGELTVCKFTTKVEDTFIYDKRSSSKVRALQRYNGGTLFQPFLDEALKHHVDCVICFTDGYNADDKALFYPNWDKVLWVLTPSHSKPTVGSSIILTDLNKEIPDTMQI